MGINRTDDQELFKAIGAEGPDYDLESQEWLDFSAKSRQGGAKTLNFYSADLAEGVLGVASFPWEYKNEPTNDGIRVNFNAMPNGGYDGYNLGMTAVQDGCRDGDNVNDTPAVAQPNVDCPAMGSVDSCFGKGVDDVTNFLDYVRDACMDHFTLGQETRMRQMWAAYRYND